MEVALVYRESCASANDGSWKNLLLFRNVESYRANVPGEGNPRARCLDNIKVWLDNTIP